MIESKGIFFIVPYAVSALLTYWLFSARHYPMGVRVLASIFGFVVLPIVFIVGNLKDFREVAER